VEEEETAAVETEDAGEGTPEGAPAGAEGGADDAQPSIIDTIFGEDPPDSIKALDAIADKDGDFKVSAAEFDEFSIGAKQFITNLRRVTTRGTQAAAEARKSAEAERKAFEQEKVRFQQERASLLGMFKDEKLQALIAAPEGETQHDAFTEEGRRALVREDAAAILREFMEKLGGVSEDYQKVADDALEETRRAEERVVLVEFIENTPDWNDYKDEALKLVQEAGMHWKDAYLLARARNPPKAAQVDELEESRRRARRVSKVGSGGAPAGLTLEQLQRKSSY
jgi:hypothetical protein